MHEKTNWTMKSIILSLVNTIYYTNKLYLIHFKFIFRLKIQHFSTRTFSYKRTFSYTGRNFSYKTRTFSYIIFGPAGRLNWADQICDTGPKKQLSPVHIWKTGLALFWWFTFCLSVYIDCVLMNIIFNFFSRDSYTDEFTFPLSTCTVTADFTLGAYSMEFF